MVEDGDFSHKKEYAPIFLENLNPDSHLNRSIWSKVTAKGERGDLPRGGVA